MYNVLQFDGDDFLLRFVFAAPDMEDHEWHHTAVARPIADWFHKSLRPLAAERGEALTAGDVVRCVTELAARELIPPTSVDWLGLALLAAHAYCQSAGRLAMEDSEEHQRECGQSEVLSEKLFEISEGFAWAMDHKLREFPAEAA